MEHWKSAWNSKETPPWHIEQVHPALVKYKNKLFNLDDSSDYDYTNNKVFIPLCGKTKDIAYFLKLGFGLVFGVEAFHQPILELEQENHFGLEFNANESTYETKDKRLVIYLGDLFECPVQKWGPFDCIWDRGSFVAINPSERIKYTKILQQSVTGLFDGKYTNFRYLISVVEYDKAIYGGPPHAADEDDMKNFYSDWTTMEILSKTEDPKDSKLIKKVGGQFRCFTLIYLLSPKWLQNS